jgi:hypothetical protein
LQILPDCPQSCFSDTVVLNFTDTKHPVRRIIKKSFQSKTLSKEVKGEQNQDVLLLDQAKTPLAPPASSCQLNYAWYCQGIFLLKAVALQQNIIAIVSQVYHMSWLVTIKVPKLSPPQ